MIVSYIVLWLLSGALAAVRIRYRNNQKVCKPITVQTLWCFLWALIAGPVVLLLLVASEAVDWYDTNKKRVIADFCKKVK